MRRPASTRTAIAFTSGATAFTVFVLGAAVEKWFISLVRPSAGELTWIGDLVLATSLGVVLYLWLNLRFTRAALVNLERDKIVLDAQLAVAAKVQRDLLPPPPLPRHGLSWAVQLVAAGRIGGDYYDFADLGGSSQIAIIGDIAGKGVPAAMMLVYVRAVFRQAVRETSQPKEIVSRLASALYAETGGESYLTCIVLRIDESAQRVTSSNAGHPPAIVTGANLRRLSTGGPPAGLFPVASYEQESTPLVTGDRIILVTDGITERMPWGLEFTAARVDPLLPASELCRRVFDWSQSPGSAPPVTDWDDDRTALVVAVD
jgi:hypothetical protein